MAKKTGTAKQRILSEAKAEALRMQRKGERVFFLHRSDFVEGQLFEDLLELFGCDSGEKNHVRVVTLRAVRIHFVKD